ncbi:hypothetical protein [Microcoleus sp. PH2017_05_CCC_O_A]|uniref:hypothetical protein n=1 Tax=Microcoleus sp. PH2017_05_CCC_O_A TaxID=2798816 RepID=UPI001D3DE9C8|nr:hypothetical protein [Microcoleus sp. PH2017_05_CCC_O_A]MCC3439123.1 hypothetical protein [Microcoleus sp. PH2017_05_CCC_O_A]
MKRLKSGRAIAFTLSRGAIAHCVSPIRAIALLLCYDSIGASVTKNNSKNYHSNSRRTSDCDR